MEYIIIQSFNTHYFQLHFQDILIDTNLLTFHILCHRTKIQNIHANQKNCNALYIYINYLYIITMNMGQ